MIAYTHAEALFRETLRKEGMDAHITQGALLALSGGKDSVLLLSLFSRYAKEKGIPFSAFHLHHGIRGAEADADRDFCKELCDRLSVPLVVAHADIPAISRETGEGMEAAARRERYRLLAETAKAQGFCAVLTAHSATDNLETVLLHLLRGGGGNALCGIPPVRPLGEGISVLRPLLLLSAEEITAALADASLPYVFDSTNDDISYTRNYVRREILPHLSRITEHPERAVIRMTENLRADMALLDGMAQDAYLAMYDGEGLDASALLALPAPLRFRVFRLFYAERAKGKALPERVHTDALFARLARTGDFTLSFPSGVTVTRKETRLLCGEASLFTHPKTAVHRGCNLLSDGSILYVLDESSKPLPQIVYTLSTQRPLASATIEGELYVRSRETGDTYRFGGVTHKLKKLYSDAHLSADQRASLPVLCDGRGILWVPGFGVRDDGGQGQRDITLGYLAAEHVNEDILKMLFDDTQE